jgi:hypothetical protein
MTWFIFSGRRPSTLSEVLPHVQQNISEQFALQAEPQNLSSRAFKKLRFYSLFDASG